MCVAWSRLESSLRGLFTSPLQTQYPEHMELPSVCYMHRLHSPESSTGALPCLGAAVS